jgi:hypothetical protein
MDMMKKLEYVSSGNAASNYMPARLLYENLQKEGFLPIRIIVSDQSMPGMMGTEMCE